ncbi:MAG: DUF4214 domain-containing protein [Cyanobacteria bacterium]|nr:DUF4214 domain-containing protein [Cyanobacteriota bacterium]
MTVATPVKTVEAVRWAYTNVLGRDVDPSGLSAYQAALEGGAISVVEMVRRLATSDEFLGQINSLSAEDKVKRLYNRLLGRDVDPAGAGWAGLLTSSGYEAVLNGILGSPEFQGRVPKLDRMTQAKRCRIGATSVVAGHSWWMEADLTINAVGDLTVIVKTTSREAMAGFTGTIIMVFRDAVGNIIGVFRTASYGVNGEWIPTAPSQRTDIWTSKVDQKIAEYVQQVDFYCTQAGPSADERFRTTATQVIDTTKWVAGALVDLVASVR